MKSPREMREDNPLDKAAFEKLSRFLSDPSSIVWFRRAADELAVTGLSSEAVRCGICEHVRSGGAMVAGFFDNGDPGFEIVNCWVEEQMLFVHMKFAVYGGLEKLKIMSAHTQRWGY